MRNFETPAARKHFVCPKPRPGLRTRFIPAFADWQLLGMSLRLTPPEQRAMAQVCQTADLLQTEAGAFLLVPCDAKLIDTLAAFDAQGEDRENDLEDEPEIGLTVDYSFGTEDDEDNGDREPDVDDEPDHDNEYDFRGPRHDMTRHDKPPLPGVKEVDGIVWVGERRAS